MKKAFSLIELMIVVAILGILAAIVIPEFQSNTKQAKEAAAKENLRIARQQLQLYLEYEVIDNPGLNGFPENPFNGLKTCNSIVLGTMPDSATGQYGWIYHTPTHTLKLDWPGTDSDGVRYFDW